MFEEFSVYLLEETAGVGVGIETALLQYPREKVLKGEFMAGILHKIRYPGGEAEGELWNSHIQPSELCTGRRSPSCFEP